MDEAFIDPNKIEPLHEIRESKKFDSLVKNMERNGWVGRPILAFDIGRGIEALTGSHRIEAARIAGLDEIPIYLIDSEIGDYVDEYGNTILDALYFDDKEKSEYLKNAGYYDAAKLMSMG